MKIIKASTSLDDGDCDPIGDISRLAETIRNDTGKTKDLWCQQRANMIFYNWRISIHWRRLINYQLPKSTLRQHLNDCFWWAL